MGLERAGRRGARFHRVARSDRPVVAQPLAGWRGWAACGVCLVPFGIGFALPVGVMLAHGLRRPEAWLSPGLAEALANTVVVGTAAAALTVAAAVVLVYALRMKGGAAARAVLPVTMLGYAAPGAVLGLGLLVPLAALDNRLADAVLAVTGRDPGLMLTGTAAALVIAYAVRFFAIAQGAVDGALGRIAPSLTMAARSLGRGPGGALRAVHLPLMRGSVGVAALIVFVDCVKELPATLLLRPFNWNTLATRVYELASLERLGEAAPAALIVMAVGLAAVAVLARATAGPAGLSEAG
jgi:iron(III) transport system permease protein